MYISNDFSITFQCTEHASQDQGRVFNCLCCTVLQLDTIVINVVRGDCTVRLSFYSSSFFLHMWCFIDF